VTEILYDKTTMEYLDSLGDGTKVIKKAGISEFQAFYKKYCDEANLEEETLSSFFDRVDEDLALPIRQRKRVALNTTKAFATWLQAKGYKPKTIRAYVYSVKTLAGYMGYSFSLKYANLPVAETAPENRQHPWTIEEVGRWVDSIDSPLYKALSTVLVQSGLDLSTLSTFTYGDIKEELHSEILPLCLEHKVGTKYSIAVTASRKKTGVSFLTFLGSWAVTELNAYLATRLDLSENQRLFPVSKQSVDKFFRQHALEFMNVETFQGRNPMRPHSLRGAFYQCGKDHRADADYMRFLTGKKVPEETLAYINKDREGWRQVYEFQIEPWTTPKRYLRKELVEIIEMWEKIADKTQMKNR
jgi:hypothetical protein